MKLSDKARASLQEVVGRFQAGDLSPILDRAKTKLSKDAPGAKWTWCNQILALAQTGSMDCRGYRQWQSVGRQVRKESSAAYILGPILVPDTNSSGEETKRLVGFKNIPVFPYHATEGDGDAFSYEPRELPPLMDVAVRMGLSVTYAATGDGSLGWCTTDGKTITLDSHDPSILFHELGHAAHKRVKGQLKGGQDPHQETTAELAACVLMDLYGYDRTGNAWAYIASYNEDPLRAILKAVDEVGKVLGLLLEEEPNQNEH